MRTILIVKTLTKPLDNKLSFMAFLLLFTYCLDITRLLRPTTKKFIH